MGTPEWRVLIADDEPAARRGVRQLLAAHSSFEVVGESRNGGEVLAALDSLKPDVIFLDIQMPGMDGFEVIRRRTPERMPVLVFLTAYDQFAIKAFEAQALDYLVKPVTEARFSASMRRVAKALKGAGSGAHHRTLLVATPGGAVVLRHSEIDWIESADNYSRLWVGKRSYMLRESMRALEDRVKADGFRRAHRRALVRLSSVRELAKTRQGEMVAVLSSGARVPISRRRRAAFTENLKS
ncbi:MAG TPA: LytTR family DNA-binding domain-containing protein [Vicinamibacterales bacterium]|nr:LytTR family DNA-binding domain-containing protein [Vicinamibacterales bacterium]